MKNIEIFDPAMCCSTGVCGPSIDPELMRVAAVVNAFKEKGISITRHGLANEPQAFVSNAVISDILQKEGVEVLPVTLVDGAIAKTREYPTNEELSTWLQIEIKVKKFKRKGSCCCESEGGC